MREPGDTGIKTTQNDTQRSIKDQKKYQWSSGTAQVTKHVSNWSLDKVGYWIFKEIMANYFYKYDENC